MPQLIRPATHLYIIFIYQSPAVHSSPSRTVKLSNHQTLNLNYYFITGTSRGIGKAMAEYLLTDKNNFVNGYARNNSISHPNFVFQKVDLSDLEAAQKVPFGTVKGAKRIALINNAGAILQVKPSGKGNPGTIIRELNLNLMAPVILINKFIEAYRTHNCEKLIVNVSSGAGKSAIDGWSTYCAAKAGIDHYSRVVDAEQKLVAENRFRIVSIAPGVVDTQMQTDIRSADPSDFSRLSDFQKYKNDKVLADPKLIAEKYFSILANLTKIDQVVFSVKDIN